MSTAATDTKRRALGKGLDSLLPRVQQAAPAPIDTPLPANPKEESRARFPST